MVAIAESSDPIVIPNLPIESVKDFIPYLADHPDTPVTTLLEPFKAFEGELRKVYARQPGHPIIQDGNINMVPLFDGHENELKIRARSLETETNDEKSRFIMPLADAERKSTGERAVVSSLKDFQQNFAIFSESSLSDLDWNNVIAAGSSVTTSLIPIPEKWAVSKKGMREWYHQHLAPASDVDLFLYGLNEEEGLEKIKQIEKSIKDGILHETTTIVLRLYDSISQIITGFDVDCACVAYDGKQVYAAPRAIASFITQTNTLDLQRRSPSYENRLSKYSRRGFEVHWPALERDRIDPTIFERSFGRTQGLARLLILEKLPKSADRDSYMDQRRVERGRPAVPRNYRHKLHNNIKDQEEDDVAEWVDQEEVASYHTMTVPYGEKYNASKINRLLYAKDLLLNAEWNQPDDRKVYLHRHPCFFGTAEEVLQDCCGHCPVAKTDEELEVAKEEARVYIHGKLQFVLDDPGRQEIGSFNPISDEEWTTMAYVGDTARLCQAIVDGDLEHVKDWCGQEGVDVNRRDYTGRTPLHLATMASTLEIVKCLVDNGARLIARLVDGRTALHIAAARGELGMVRLFMDRSLANQEAEDEKEEALRMARKTERASHTKNKVADGNAKHEAVESRDEEMNDSASEITLDSDDDKSDVMTQGSFVKIESDGVKKNAQENVLEDETCDDSDIIEIDIIAWDYGLSPLHLAILNGHLPVIELLVSEYGADVLLPVKLVHPGSTIPNGAIMTIVLASSLPPDKARAVVKLLLELGATSAQADFNHFTALHYMVGLNNHDILDVLLENDRPAALSVINSIGSTQGWGNENDSPLTTAIKKSHTDMVTKMLSLGANSTTDFDTWIKAHLQKNKWAKIQTSEQNLQLWRTSISQPIVSAAIKELGQSVRDLLAHGADPSSLEKSAYNAIANPQNAHYQNSESLLDIIQKKIKALREWKHTQPNIVKEPERLQNEQYYTGDSTDGTYQHWSAVRDYRAQVKLNLAQREVWERSVKTNVEEGINEKKLAITTHIQDLEETEKVLIQAGAKTFVEMYPDIPKSQAHSHQPYVYPEPGPYKTSLSFRIPDLNDAKRTGYNQLFEAAWNNDLPKIKTLTLAPWTLDPKNPDMIPLFIGVTDHNGFSPFSIAILRGHRDLARSIIDICAAQYHKDDGMSSKQKWNMKSEEIDDDEKDSEAESDDEGLPIIGELVNNTFTIENIAGVSKVVKSNVQPLTMLNWNCSALSFLGQNKNAPSYAQGSLIDYAIQSDNPDLLEFLISIGAEQQARSGAEKDDRKTYTIQQQDFQTAVRLGRVSMLATMIKATGSGIPLKDLVEKSGVEIKDRPRYYQGLSVGGKKRADWAQAPGERHQRTIEATVPPLLQAAFDGSVDSVEWFMSDAPLRRYKEFAGANKTDKHIETLEKSGKGYDKTISAWLNTKSELVLHAAILHAGKEDKVNYIALIKYILSVTPETLEKTSSEGFTPLSIAVLAQQPEAVAFLISQGANQRHRDKFGRNPLHLMLTTRTHNTAKTDEKALRSMIELFDKHLIREMMVERCTLAPGSLTPLANWMARNMGSYKKTDIAAILAEYSTGEDLEMINGEGDLPLHVAIKQSLSSLTSYVLSRKPALLYRENSTGRTPLEMARDIYTASQVENAPNVSGGPQHYHPGSYDRNSLLNQPSSSFVKSKTGEVVPEESKKRTLEVCIEADGMMVREGRERKRRIVSLFEANEVAKRVASLKTGSRWGGNQIVVNGGLIDGEIKDDVISKWMRHL